MRLPSGGPVVNLNEAAGESGLVDLAFPRLPRFHCRRGLCVHANVREVPLLDNECIMSAAGSPLQVIHAGVGSQALQYLPYCLVPTVLMPFYLLTHAIVAAQLAATRAAPAALSHA